MLHLIHLGMMTQNTNSIPPTPHPIAQRYWFRPESQKHKSPKFSSIQGNINYSKTKTEEEFTSGAQHLKFPFSPPLECVHSYLYKLFLTED